MRKPKPVQMRVGEFYTMQGAAAALELSYWTVYRYVRVAGIPTTWLGNQMLVRLEDLRDLGTPAGTQGDGPAGAPGVQAGDGPARWPGVQAGDGPARWPGVPLKAGARRATPPLVAPATVPVDGPALMPMQARAKRCPECGEASLVYEEGCKKCFACGYSAC